MAVDRWTGLTGSVGDGRPVLSHANEDERRERLLPRRPAPRALRTSGLGHPSGDGELDGGG
ncbi:hypothetical protein [Umezawaea beigongshangensis]|uniref:hypothetical protein n=1 Tax=Umezawaea beigongshangensis TaxID=2780383 RepID=UPI0018F1DCE6|nr:hypothetical protein [Umezawaea beigongshangensis]